MSEDNDVDIWEDYREAQKQRRLARLPLRQRQIESLKDGGFVVEQKTEYQYRINHRLDLYPIHNRYHDIKTDRRGGYADATQFVRRFFNYAK